LRESRGREEVIIRNAADVICSIDYNAIIRTMSPASLSVLGYAPRDMVGKNLCHFMQEEDAIRALGLFGRQSTEDKDQSEDFSFVHADGRRLDMALSVRWLADERLFSCILLDITDRVELQAMKMALSKTVNDIRAPLRAIEQLIQSAYSEQIVQLSVAGKQLVQAAGRSCSRMTTLAQDLEFLDRKGIANRYETVQMLTVEQIMQAAKESVLGQAKQNKVTIEISQSEALSKPIPEQMTRVFTNILSNAVKFSSINGLVTILSEFENNTLSVKFIDRGRGIPGDIVNDIFEPFKQVLPSDEKIGGAGLGLAICKSLVGEFGGSITVVSAPGVGSTFTVSLPIAATCVEVAGVECAD
jgi:PAS domain S-box-containing protein